jgi:DNA replication initiation complex subunit (GINS family)
MSEEDDNVLTFSELRKTQKKENREEELTELDEKFLLRASNYFSRKKEAEGESREYKNARRVLDKIISLREEKIVKEARLAVKTGSKSPGLNLLPEEQELFRNLKNMFESHRSRVEETVESTEAGLEGSDPKGDTNVDLNLEESSPEEGKKSDTEDESVEEQRENSSEEDRQKNDSEEVEDGYTFVKTTSEVPEFMGTDLEAYGPFDEGEEVKIPDDNAEILVNRGNAELIKE